MHYTSLFQTEYLKKFAEEQNQQEFEEILKQVNDLSQTEDVNQLLNSIDKLRETVFKRLL